MEEQKENNFIPKFRKVIPLIKRKIFSFLSEKDKLEKIKYNKFFQKELKIDIENYKKLSGKYIIKNENNKVKIYKMDTNILIYEGEYLNQRKTGKGKEYDIYGRLIYEGNYLKGKKNGNGKEYYENGNILFEGEYIDNKRYNGKGYNFFGVLEFEINKGNGNIKEYNYSGDLLFYGKYLNSEKNGIGNEYYNGFIYIGEYKNGKKNGKGKEFDYSGNIFFEGEYLNGKRWNGKIYDVDGNLSDELKNGCGKNLEYYEGYSHEGEYLNSEKNGKGNEYDIKKWIWKEYGIL